MPAAVEISGFSDLAKSLAATGPDVRRALRANLESIAAPVARDAEQLALTEISHIGKKWWRMRTGITRSFSLVYVAPFQRGVKTRGPDPRRRPQFAEVMRDKAMGPALDRNIGRIISDTEELIDGVTARRW